MMKSIRSIKQSVRRLDCCSSFANILKLGHPTTAKSGLMAATKWQGKTALGYSRSLSAWPSEMGYDAQKTAFIYQQKISILDEKKQGCYLTKSILKSGLPDTFQKPLDINQEEIDNIMEKFEQNIIDSRLFCSGDDYHKRQENSALNMFLNMMQIVWANTSHRYPSNLSKCLNYKQHFAATFTRLNEYNVQITGKPQKSFLMMSKQKLKQFAMDSEILQSTDQVILWDEVFKPIFHMPELKTSFKTEGPFLAGAPFPNPHTLFIVADKKMKMEHLIGQGLLYSFANAYTHALAQPQNAIGMEKIEPVPVQCVINNGRQLTFICYQLNTLDFKSDEGVKNFAWIEESLPMFEEAHLKIPGDKRYKGIEETSISVDGINKEVFEKFLKFTLNN